MKNILFTVLILITSSCGIDKESPASLASVANSGELDPTFFGNGILTIHNSALGNDNDEIFDVAVDSQDRVVAVGQSINGSSNSDLIVWRLTTDGLLDSTFNGDGVFLHDSAAGGSGNDTGYGVAIGPSDEVYITGSSINGAGNSDMVVWKLTSSGNLDTSFNGTGFFTHDNAAGGSLYDQGNSIALDSTGKVIVAGYSDQTVTNRDMAVWKLNSNGTLDTGFDSDGYYTGDGFAGGQDDIANALKVDSVDNIYVVGQADSAGNVGDMAAWKFSSAGALDSSFNGSGVFTHNGAAGGSNLDAANDLSFDSNGALYITGFSKNGAGNNDMVIWKLLSSGTLDVNFDSDGLVVFDVSTVFGGTTSDAGESIIVDSEDRIVVAGSGNGDMCAWRYNSDGTIDTNFNTDGFFSNDSAAGGFNGDSAMGVGEDSKNRLYFGGFSENNSGDNDAAFWRMK